MWKLSSKVHAGYWEMNPCDLCPRVYTPVPPSGPIDCDLLFCGEAPGKQEQDKGIPFIGKTGREVNEHYLPLAGLRRENVYFTNAIKCLPPGQGGKLDISRPKDMGMLISCAEAHLYRELSHRYKLLIPMGAAACYAVDPDIQLDLQHGIPLETSWGTVFPMWHPAGGVHEPKKMLHIRNDWVRLGKYIKGKLKLPVDQYPKPDYRHIKAGELLDEYLTVGDTYGRPLACDTEITRHKDPFCLTYSLHPGSGNLIKADDVDALEIFQVMLDQWRGPILFHNWLFDGEVVRAMGLRFPEHLIQDTMVRTFHLGNLPQGLKALAYRLLGMKMKDFDDVVTPRSLPLALDYLRRAQEIEWPKPPEEMVRDETGKWKLYKPQSMSTKLKRFFTDYAKNPNKDVFKMWSDSWADSTAQIEEKLGRWPGKCITHVPMEEVIWYACRDADATLRLHYMLEAMTRQVRRKPQEHWGD